MSISQAKVAIDEKFLPALKTVPYPGFDTDIVTMGLVEEARMEGTKAIIKLKALAAPPEVLEQLENGIAAALTGMPGVEELELIQPEPPKQQKVNAPQAIPGVAAVVPVASGKGGVGKSTVAVNLALGLAALGLKVGLLDLDLYGPSLPLMLGLTQAQPEATEDKLLPIAAHGLKTMSIGFMVDAGKALIWRGPIIMKAVRQLLHDVAWAPLDVLILDLPPGTGDVQITMTQEVPITGAVVVTTPQDVALVDAIKAVDMFRATNSPVLGIVENMSYFVCDGCEKRHEIFGHGTVAPLAARLGVDYLGELPLDPKVRAAMDAGQPIVEGTSAAAQAYRELAAKVWDRVKALLPSAEAK
jgi:ATP-binding protein involved in chromosome partitioning